MHSFSASSKGRTHAEDGPHGRRGGPRRWLASLLILLIRCYQLLLSPWLGQHCRFYPSCSSYAVEALETHGPASGSYLTLRRLLRCHPWHPGGADPVPPVCHRDA